MLSFTDPMGCTTQVAEGSVVAVVECPGAVWVIAPNPQSGITMKAAAGSFDGIVAQLPGLEAVESIGTGFGIGGQAEVMADAGRTAIRRPAVERTTTNPDESCSWLYFASVPDAVICMRGRF